jgi:hypothetical protein
MTAKTIEDSTYREHVFVGEYRFSPEQRSRSLILGSEPFWAWIPSDQLLEMNLYNLLGI